MTANLAEKPQDDVKGSIEAAFCPRLWDEMELTSAGGVRPCCFFEGSIRHSGTPITVYTAKFANYSGSTDLQQMRSDMLAGRKVSGCRKCYRAEDIGDRSIRQSTIANRGGLEAAVSAAIQAPQSPPVRKLMVEFGDKCALKCRMCRPYHSTSIAADAKQVDLLYPYREVDKEYAVLSALPRSLRWYEDERFCTTTLVEACADVDELKVVGGEPFISPNFIRFLNALERQGLSRQLSICVTTSGSLKDDAWLKAIDGFQRKSINLSIDGIGELNAYIRAGSDWDQIQAFIATARQASVPIQILTTVQAYNLFRIAEISAFASAGGHSWWPTWLFDPIFLDPANFPVAKRGIFMDGIQAQLAANSSRALQTHLLGYFDRLAQASSEKEAPWDRFVRYTREMDRSRNQSLASVAPELFAAF